MDATSGAVEGLFHVGPELVDQGSSAGLGEASEIAVDVNDEELLDAKTGPHGAKALGLQLFAVGLAAVSSEVDRGVDRLSAAVDINQVVDAVDPIEQLLGGGLIKEAVLVSGSDTLSVDASGVQEQSGGVEVAFGLTDASGLEDALEGGFKLQAIGGECEGHGWAGVVRWVRSGQL